jgi:hypothetical protein
VVTSRLRVGSVVTWSHRGGSATGKIVKLVTSGKLKIPDSSLVLTASADEPAALIRLIRNNELTKVMVGHKLSSLSPARQK